MMVGNPCPSAIVIKIGPISIKKCGDAQCADATIDFLSTAMRLSDAQEDARRPAAEPRHAFCLAEICSRRVPSVF